MVEAKITDFPECRESTVLKRSPAFYFFRVGGFVIAVFGSSLAGVYGIATSNVQMSFAVAFGLVLIGFGMFIASWRASNFCRICGGKIETFFSAEERADGRYSGNIFVCRHCNAYEARLNYEPT
ncbi:MAG: hypothetical protein A3I66_14380 [Burkholderiales bacterium RIFCSPLOWO2_02_FULL_57_36]|nr:MAG: hypothetical protein A3I66_14380 [Burkholderiales bacterium RIFCSPLOWO2_02_FULL_57_36]